MTEARPVSSSTELRSLQPSKPFHVEFREAAKSNFLVVRSLRPYPPPLELCGKTPGFNWIGNPVYKTLDSSFDMISITVLYCSYFRSFGQTERKDQISDMAIWWLVICTVCPRSLDQFCILTSSGSRLLGHVNFFL